MSTYSHLCPGVGPTGFPRPKGGGGKEKPACQPAGVTCPAATTNWLKRSGKDKREKPKVQLRNEFG